MYRKASLFGPGDGRAALLALLSTAYAASAIAAPGDPQGPPIPLLEAPLVTQYSPLYVTPRTARDGVGNSLAIWPVLDGNGETSTLFGQRFASDGTALGNAFVVASGLLYSGLNLQVAMNASGQFAVSWVNATANSTDSIQVQMYQPDGTPSGSPINITGYDASLAMTANGKAVVSWDTSLTIRLSKSPCALGGNPSLIVTTIQARQFNEDGTAAGGVKTVDSQYFAGCPYGQGIPTASNPSIAVDAAGNYVVGYQKDFHYWVRRFYPSGWAITAKLQTPLSTSVALGPLVASDAAGNFVVTAQGSAQLYTARGQPNGGLLQLNASGAAAALAMDDNGDFVVGWNGALIDGNGNGVYVQRYTSTGVASGEPILVDGASYNGVNAVYFEGPSLAMDPVSGNFSVGWMHSTSAITNPPTNTYSNQFYLGLYEGP